MFLGGVSAKKIYLDYFVVFLCVVCGRLYPRGFAQFVQYKYRGEVPDCAFVKSDGIGKFKVDAAGGQAKVEIGKDGIVVLLFKRK